MSDSTLSIVDNRTKKQYEIKIQDGFIRASDLKNIKQNPEDFGLVSYDPAYLNTASCRSAITFIDGDKGILRYRGYPIEELAGTKTYVEVVYLLMYGELPSLEQAAEFEHNLINKITVPSPMAQFFDAFADNAHPMSMLLSGVGALGAFYPESRLVDDKQERLFQALRLVAQVVTVAAAIYRKGKGLKPVSPNPKKSLVDNFLWMSFENDAQVNRHLQLYRKTMDILFILHADHEQNCSTSAMRSVGSSRADAYSSAAAAIAALFGPLHGGANEAVLKMLKDIGDVKNVPQFIREIKEGKGGARLMGFGHRVYKSYDPRAKIVKQLADEILSTLGRNPLLDIAFEIERIALQDEYFVSRKLYPNVDFYTGIIYQAMGFDEAYFTVLFAVARMSGWVIQWMEMLADPEQKITRPRQIYTGMDERHVP